MARRAPSLKRANEGCTCCVVARYESGSPPSWGENRSNASAGPDQSLACLSLAGQRQRFLERLNLRYPACMRRTAKAVIRSSIPLLGSVESRLCVESKLNQ